MTTTFRTPPPSTSHRIIHTPGADRVSAAGFGESRPKLLGTTPEARAANRRVEIMVRVEELVRAPGTYSNP